MMGKTHLLGKTPEELSALSVSLGLPKYTGGQIARWLYVRRVFSIDDMTDISLAGRAALKEGCESGLLRPSEVQVSSDGTKKYLFPVGEGSSVEAVMIPDGERRTLCVSSQSGCRMGCRFCATGRQGYRGSLSASAILSQFLSVDEASELTNAVFMGMGEPLDNYDEVMRAIEVLTAPWGFAWSPKRITLSTIGVLPRLREFIERSHCHLAISLHNPFPEERAEIMPVEKAYPVTEVVRLVRKADFSGQRRVSFEYTMFEGLNDSPRHCEALARLLRGIECRVNLIRFHSIPEFPHKPSSQKVMESFRDSLSAKGITCTIRASRGEDILAACGLLAGTRASQA